MLNVGKGFDPCNMLYNVMIVINDSTDFEEGKISAKKLHKLVSYVYAPKKK